MAELGPAWIALAEAITDRLFDLGLRPLDRDQLRSEVLSVLKGKGVAETRLAKQVEVRRQGGKFELRVDGEAFPWYILERPTVVPDKQMAPAVTLSLVAERVLIDDDIRSQAEREAGEEEPVTAHG